jgi:SAM-dependent methyltransferase
VLDVGCSTGGFLHQLHRRFPGDYTLLGTDVSREPLEYAERQGVATWHGDFLQIPRPPGGYAAITFWAVLEHLAEPARFLDHAAHLLANEGRCFVLVPNCESLAFRLLGARYRYVLPEHLNYFRRASLLRLAGRRFEVLEATSTHFNPVVLLKDAWRGPRPVPRDERVALLKQTTRWKESQWLIPLQWGYRSAEALLRQLDLADNLCLVLTPKTGK